MTQRRIMGLTVIQPWAELIAAGVKDVENRSWAPTREVLEPGDFLAIHAGKTVDSEHWAGALETCASIDPTIIAFPVLRGLSDLPVRARGDRFDQRKGYAEKAVPYGAIVAVARYRGHARASGSPWFVGPVAWLLKDAVRIDPVPCSGQRGLWSLSEPTLDLVRERFAASRRKSTGA